MDKYRGITRLPLVESRIGHLLNRLSSNRAVGSYSTQEQLVRAYADISKRILDGFDKRIYDLPKVVRGTPVNETNINLYLLGVYSEILYLMEAVGGTAEMVEENFNFAIATIRKLQGDVKYCRQQLSAFALYATQYGDTLHFGETFSNETNIDRGSSLLGQEECFIDTAEGNISLPRLEEVDQRQIAEIQVGALSNGILGSNTEANTPVRGSIQSMYDDNVDTWTEYERIVDQEDSEGLKLELKVLLKEAQIVNGIKIHPVFLGARTPFSIREIEVSQDGRKWISLRDEVSVADFLDEDAEHRFHLSPHSSKFAGEFNITFAPRFIKFIRFLIKQSSAFPIFDTYNKRHMRYAIAIKEIGIFGYKYSSAGEIVSKPISFSRDIAALSLQSLIDPPGVPKEVGGAEYYISYDDGASWFQMTTLEEASLDIPEILFPPSETSAIRYKLHLFKDELAFTQKVQKLEAVSFVERFSWSSRRPFILPLLHKPESGSLTICDPEAANRGKVHPLISLGRGINNSLVLHSETWRRHGNTQLRLKLPIKEIKDPSTLSIYVNQHEWTRVNTISDFTSYYSTQYVLERDSNSEFWEVVFGNDETVSPAGKIPSPGDEVSMYFSEEDCSIKGLVSPYTLNLDYPSDGIKENTTISFYGQAYGPPPVIIPSGIKRFKLPHENIIVGESYEGQTYEVSVVARNRSTSGQQLHTRSTNPAMIANGSFRLFKTFVNGDSELTDPGDWTVDSKTGTVYTETEINSDWEYSISYWWKNIIELSSADWDFVEGKLDEIQIYESGYKTRSASYNMSDDFSASSGDGSVTIVGSDGNVIKGIVSKSLRIVEGTLNEKVAFEVPFIDGNSEFRGRAKIQDEEVSVVTSGGDNIAKFRVTHWQNLVSTASPFFPGDPGFSTFIQEKANYASLLTTGDYFFDTTGVQGDGVGYVYVNLGGSGLSIPSGQTISYQYYDQYERDRFKGAYSINPSEGILYFSEPLSSTDYDKSITFKYTPYKIRYNISVQLTEDVDYELDIENQTIQVKAGAKGANEKFLVVNYKYQPEDLNTIDLAPYYSPLVRALDIKVS
jgi:hypothetical protein